MEENRIPKIVLYMNLGTARLRGRLRNRWKEEVREDGRIVGGEGWQEKVHNREEWKKLLRTARNRRILHVPKEWNECCLFYYHGHSCQNDCYYLELLNAVIILIFHFHFLVFCWADSYEVNFWETGSR
jgi:hypothetical protein